MADDIKHNSEILRAQDIIPASEPKLQQDCQSDNIVPRFDLATEIMAQQRRLTSSRRKKPENKAQTVKEEFQAEPHASSAAAFALQIPMHSIIAEIVRRDIQEMLMHSRPQV